MTLDLSLIRSQFPALAGDAVFLDNPAGTQVAAQVLKRINQYLVEMNANAHGAFPGQPVQIFIMLPGPKRSSLARI